MNMHNFCYVGHRRYLEGNKGKKRFSDEETAHPGSLSDQNIVQLLFCGGGCGGGGGGI